MMMIKSDLYKHQLMWGPKHNSWQLVTCLCLLAWDARKPCNILQCHMQDQPAGHMEDQPAGCVANIEHSQVARLVKGFENAQAGH